MKYFSDGFLFRMSDFLETLQHATDSGNRFGDLDNVLALIETLRDVTVSNALSANGELTALDAQFTKANAALDEREAAATTKLSNATAIRAEFAEKLARLKQAAA